MFIEGEPTPDYGGGDGGGDSGLSDFFQLCVGAVAVGYTIYCGLTGERGCSPRSTPEIKGPVYEHTKGDVRWRALSPSGSQASIPTTGNSIEQKVRPRASDLDDEAERLRRWHNIMDVRHAGRW